MKKSFEKVFINRDGNPIKVKIVSLKSILTKEQYQSIYHLVTTNTRWYMDNYSGEYYGYANIEKAPGCEKLLFNKIELKDHVWGEGDKLLAATIYCEVCQMEKIAVSFWKSGKFIRRSFSSMKKVKKYVSKNKLTQVYIDNICYVTCQIRRK